MKTLMHVLSAVSLVLLVGCGGEEEKYSRYPSVCIPGYTKDDYVEQLSDENSEKVYNAICRLGSSARNMGNALWGEKADPESDDWQMAQRVYSEMRIQLQSKDPIVLAASLRFLQLFAGSHASRSELVDPVCRINSRNPVVQFEQVELLKQLADDETMVPEPLLRRLLNSRSWIVSRNTYGLIGGLANEGLRAELLQRYTSSADEIEHTLILVALGEGPSSPELEFMMNEVLHTESAKIRNCAFHSVLGQLESPAVQRWISKHAAEFDPDEQKWIFNAAGELDSTEAALTLMHEMLACGYTPDDDFLDEVIALEDKIARGHDKEKSDEDMEEAQKALAGVGELIAAHPVLAQRLEEVRKRKSIERHQYAVLSQKLDPLKDDFIAKTRRILTENGVPEDKQQEFLKPVTGLDAMRVVQAISQ